MMANNRKSGLIFGVGSGRVGIERWVIELHSII